MVINVVITSDTISKVGNAICHYSKKLAIMANKSANNNNNNIIKNIIPQTQSKLGVLQRKTFFHTPDEARSVGLAKACVLSKTYSVIEK